MAATVRLGVPRWFGWVGSDGWSARALVSDGNEEAVEGTISVQPQANPVRGFAEYFLNLTVENNRRNPWFVGNYPLIYVDQMLRRPSETLRRAANAISAPQSSGRITSNAATPVQRARRTTASTHAPAADASGSAPTMLSSRSSCSSSPTRC